MCDMLYETRQAEANIHLLDVKAKKIYSKTKEINPRAVRSDIKALTEKLFLEYGNEKYKSHPDYEIIFWEYIKESKNSEQFQEYLSRFPNGTFAGLAKLKITRLSNENKSNIEPWTGE
jgi:hypothetical protein